MSDPRPFRLFAGISATVIVVQFVWLTLEIGGEFATTAFTDLLGIPCALAATAGCIWAARRAETRARRAWFLLGASTASWASGEVVWSYYEVVLRREAPFPGLADVGFLGLVPLAAAAVLAFPTAPKSTPARIRAVLEGLIIAGSVLFVGWAVFLGPVYAASEGGLLLQIVGLAYPIGDIVIIAIVLYVLSRASHRDRVALGLVAAGLISIAAADAGFTYLTLKELYTAGSLIDPLWNTGFLLIALGAVRLPSFASATLDDRRIGMAAIAVPYVPFFCAVGAAVLVQVTRGALEPFLFWDAVIIVVLLTVRQLLALVDNWSLNRDLERRVAERTVELRSALAELEQSKRLQDEFVANASHELLTPLTVIMSSLEILRLHEDGFSEDDEQAVDMARAASVRMKRLVENVLVASGAMTRVDCDRVPFDVDAEIRTAIQSIGPCDKVFDLHIGYPLRAVGDAERFRMAVEHVLRNADKFAPTSSTVRIDGYTVNDQVHVVVADEGPGIPDEQRESVFRRFFQTDGSSTRRFGGLGLGLYLARHLSVSMGGTLTADASSSGARLHLALPAASSSRRIEHQTGHLRVVERDAGRGVA